MKKLEKNKIRGVLVSLWVITILISSSMGNVASTSITEKDRKTQNTKVILIEKTGSESLSVLDDIDSDIIDEYGNYILMEVQDKRSIDKLEKEGVKVNTLTNRRKISVKGYTFDIPDGTPDIDPDLKIEGYEKGNEGMYIVHMLGPINPEWRENLENQGVDIFNYVPNYAYEVSMTPSQAEKVKDLFFVDWVGIYQPAYKLDSEINPNQSINVMFQPNLNDNNKFTMGSKINSEDYEGIDVKKVSQDGNEMTVSVNSEDHIKRIANMKEVYFISQKKEPKLHDEIATQITGGGTWINDPENNPYQPYRAYGDYGSYINQLGYTGKNITVAVADTGIYPDHLDFQDRVIGGYSFTGDGDWTPGHFHGTHCAGSVAGNTYNGTGITIDQFSFAEEQGPYYAGQGSAPQADLFSVRIFGDSAGYVGPANPYKIMEVAAENSDTYIHSNSWGSPVGGEYTELSQSYDRAVRDSTSNVPGNQPMVITSSASNEGPDKNTIGAPATGKNVITVGATENFLPDFEQADGADNPDNISDFSSRGWTDDKRIKPDIVAPGEEIISTGPDSEDQYLLTSGTSMSNPNVAGQSAVVVQWYKENFGVKPSPAMVKSILINTAHDLDESNGNTEPIPNRDEGWGMVDTSKLQYPKDDPLQFRLIDQPVNITTGEEREYVVSPEDVDEPLKMTLTWTDKEAKQGDNFTLKNDLNIEVVSPTGEVYRGNAFDTDDDNISDNGYTHPNTGAMKPFDSDEDGWDDINNVENIYISPEDVEFGAYTIRVKGHNIPADANNDDQANQDFAITAYNVQSEPTKDGEIQINADEYKGNEDIKIKLSDSDLSGQGTYEINVTSTNEEGNLVDEKWVTLAEKEGTGIFLGSISTTMDPGNSADLYVEHGGEISANYFDEDPGPNQDELVDNESGVDSSKTEINSDSNPNEVNIDELGPNESTHDVGVESIISPDSIVWDESQLVKVNVSNHGDYNESGLIVNVTGKRKNGFLGSFPPYGWETDDWQKSDSNEAGEDSPEANLFWRNIEQDQSYLVSPTYNTTGKDQLTLEFNSYIEHYENSFDAMILVRGNSSQDWVDVSPWENPVNQDIGPETYNINVSDYIGEGTQIKFEYVGSNLNIENWYLDDVMLDSNIYEYSDQKVIDLGIGETKTLNFENWTPSSVSNYEFNATIDHTNDSNLENNTKTKDVLVKPIIYDLEASSIDAPRKHVYQYEQPVNGTITNVGNQNITDTPVNMTIEPIKRITEIEENFTDFSLTDWEVEDMDGNGNTWTPEQGDFMELDPKDHYENDILWTETLNCTKGTQNVIIEFNSKYSGTNDRNLLISTDGGQSYQKIGRNIGNGKITYNLTQWASGKENVKIGWEFFTENAENDEFWRIDDFELINEFTVEEYNSQKIIDELNTTESLNITFDSWTPNNNSLPTDYLVTLRTLHGEDSNVDNDAINKRIFVNTNQPPDEPENPDPYNDQVGTTHSPRLRINVSDPNEDDLDVTFYLLNETQIEIKNKTLTKVKSGTRTSVQFTNLKSNSTYKWYVEVDDGNETNVTQIYTFHTYIPEPIWKKATARINAEPPEQVGNLSIDWDDDIWNVEANKLTWDASFDDGSGENDTDHYNIYRSDSNEGPWDESTLIDKVQAEGSEKYNYLDVNKADDGIRWNYVIRAVDRVGNMEMNEKTISERPLPKITNPSPINKNEVGEIPIELSIDVESLTGEPLNVQFFEDTDDSLIGIQDQVMNGTVSMDWDISPKDMNKTYSWYATVSYENTNFTKKAPSHIAQSYEYFLKDTMEPNADAGQDINANQGNSVVLNGTGSSDNIGIVNWTWVIENPNGEETVKYGESVSYHLEYPLTYDVELTVLDEVENQNTDSMNIYANDSKNPVAEAGISDQTQVDVNYTLDGSASTDNVGITNWTWSIKGVSGDALEENYDEVEYGEIIDHSFPYSGTYDISLEVSDAEGNIDNDSISIIVNPVSEPNRFMLDVEDITAGESPVINIYGAEDQYGEELNGDYSVEITINEITRTTNLNFENGTVEYIWDEFTKMGRYLVDASIGDVVRLSTFNVKSGEVYSVTVTPSNKQNVTAGDSLELSAQAFDKYGNLITEAEEDFDWNEAENGIFEKTESGEYTVSASYSGVSSSDVTVIVSEPYFEVEILSYDKNVNKEDKAVIKYKVTNTGNVDGSQDIVFKVNNEQVKVNEDFPLKAGEEYIGEFSWKATEIGDYNIEITSDDVEKSIEGQVKDETNRRWILSIAGWITAAVAIVVIIYITIINKNQ